MSKVLVTAYRPDTEKRAQYLSLEVAQKLDDIRSTLQRGDIKGAAQLGQVYTLQPIAANFLTYAL